MTRREKLVFNLLLTALALIGVWFFVGRPLPLRMDYRRAEQAYFMTEKEVLQVWRKEGRILSYDRENLYLFQQHGWLVENRSIQQFPMEDGFGCAMAVQNKLAVPMVFYAWDASTGLRDRSV